MSRTELIRIISRDDKAVNEVKGPLSILYRRVLFDLGIDAATLEQQLDRWVEDPNGPVEQTTKKRTQARGNYIKKMIEPYMTWKSFVDLMMMLYPKYIRVEVKLGWPGNDTAGNPRETSHFITMDTSYLLKSNELTTYFDEQGVIGNYHTSMEGDTDEDTEDIYGNSLNGETVDDFEEDDDDD